MFLQRSHSIIECSSEITFNHWMFLQRSHSIIESLKVISEVHWTFILDIWHVTICIDFQTEPLDFKTCLTCETFKTLTTPPCILLNLLLAHLCRYSEISFHLHLHLTVLCSFRSASFHHHRQKTFQAQSFYGEEFWARLESWRWSIRDLKETDIMLLDQPRSWLHP